MRSNSSNFNSIKVRLERTKIISISVRIKFQFHKGTIRTKQQYHKNYHHADFNSIKVRLERSAGVVCDTARCQFQFHKGTIRTEIY